MNGVVANILNKVLGDWIENLDPEKLSLSVFSGDILLQDLRIKSSAFDNLGLPFRLVHGYIGKICAKIAWTSLASSPLKVLIEHVQVFLKPVQLEQWKEEYEVARYISKKLSLLQDIEALKSTEIESKSPGFVEKLAAKVLDNLQIEIKSIYVNFYDEISSDAKFSLGFGIDSLKAVTCNSDWAEEFIEGASVKYKLLQVSNARVFLDYENFNLDNPMEVAVREFIVDVPHNFILYKTSLRLEAIVNKKKEDFDMPQVRLNFSTDASSIKIDTIQLKHLIKSLNLFNYFKKFQKGVISTIKESTFSQQEGDFYRDLYIQSKTPSKNKAKTEQIRTELEKLEKEKTWESIIQQRNIAGKEFELRKLEAATKQEIETASSAPSSFSKLSGFFSSKPNISEEEKKEKLEKLRQKLNSITEERLKLSTEVEDLISDTDLLGEFPSDKIRYEFNFFIGNFSLRIAQGSLELLEYTIKKLSFKVLIAKVFFDFSMSIQASELLDLQDPVLFPNILKSTNYDFFVNNKSGLDIKMNSGDLFVVVKQKSILRTLAAVKESFEKNLDYSNYGDYSQVTTEKTMKLIAMGEEYISNVMNSGIQTSVALDIEIRAPAIIFPLNKSSKEALIIDMGGIQIKSTTKDPYDQSYSFKLHSITISSSNSQDIQNYNQKKSKSNKETLIEEWNFIIGLKTGNNETPINVCLDSSDFLNVNISSNMIKNLAKVNKNLKQTYEEVNQETSEYGASSYVFILNKLGEDVFLTIPDQEPKVLKSDEKVKVHNMNEVEGEYSSHVIINLQDSDQVYIDVRSSSKEFTIRKKDSYINILLRLLENSSDTIFILETSTVLYNKTDIPIDLSTTTDKIQLIPGAKINLPVSWINQDLKVLTDKGPTPVDSAFVRSDTHIFIEKISGKDISGYSRLFYVFLPSFFIQNLLPCSIDILVQSEVKKELRINPGEIKSLGLNPKSLGRIQLALQLNHRSPSRWAELSLLPIKLEFPDDDNEAMIEPTEYDICSLLAEYSLITKNINCKLFQIYSSYILVNQTIYQLEIKKNLNLRPKSINFLRLKKDKIKIRAKNEGKYSNFSNNIDTKILGMFGCIKLDNSKNSRPQEILLGVKILSSPAPLYRTKAIYICPRYILSNLTERPLYIRQVIGGKPGNIIITVPETLHYNLENSYESNLVQISTNLSYWSKEFSIDEIAEFQVSLPSLVSERVGAGPWHLPGPTNDNKTFVLATISTEDQCIINITFKNPVEPEFLIANYTDGPITLLNEKYSYTIPPAVRFPWAGSEKVTVIKDNQEATYSLLKVKKKAKKINLLNAEVKISGITRILELGSKEEIKENEIILVKEVKTEFVASLAGLGISVFSDQSCEMFFLSISYIYTRFQYKDCSNNEKKFEIDASIGKIQLDNMETEVNQFPVIFAGPGDSSSPFFQVNFHKTTNPAYSKYTWIEIQFQEIIFKINQEVIYKISNFVRGVKQIFIEPKECIYGNVLSIPETFPALSPLITLDLDKQKQSTKVYVTVMRLHALKIVLSFKVSPPKFELKLDPRQFSIGQAFATVFGNITDSNLVFTEVLVTDIFQTPKKLVDTIAQNYTRQASLQIFKILGSSDILGNPVRLMGKLGTGVFEFVSEPVKGVLKGPREFKDGVKIGIKSFVSNVIGGGLQSVSTMTGGLYNVVNKLKGDKPQDLGNEKIGTSIVGGLKDIGKGVTGIFSKPWQGLKTGGSTGLFKGIGTGIVGAVTAPISAGLRISSGITAGVSSNISNTKSQEINRVREPKVLNPK